MDYDKTAIAATYDAARGLLPEAGARWMDLVAAHAPSAPQLVLDLGCGTGRFTGLLADRFDARVIGVDPSASMLAEGRRKAVRGRVEFMQASAESLPLEAGCADLVFMSMMLHHLGDRARAAGECRRVLGSGGRIFVRNTTRESLYPHTRFFPGFQAIVDAQLPTRDEVVVLFERTGLRLRAYEVVATRSAGGWSEFADKIALRADSFIVRLPLAEFEAGMTALRDHAFRNGGTDPVVQEVSYFVFGE
jgi:SAM-dependent methyltransferase